jgi:hypothetical protein
MSFLLSQKSKKLGNSVHYALQLLAGCKNPWTFPEIDTKFDHYIRLGTQRGSNSLQRVLIYFYKICIWVGKGEFEELNWERVLSSRWAGASKYNPVKRTALTAFRRDTSLKWITGRKIGQKWIVN